MTILGLNYSPEPTGIAPYTSDLATDLARRGHEVRVLTTHPHYPAWRIMDGYGQWRTTRSIDDVRVTRLRHFVPKKPTHLQRMISEVSFGLRVVCSSWGGPDVVVTVSPALFADWLIRMRLAVTPDRPATVMWVQDLYARGVVETGGGDFGLAFVKHVESTTMRAADAVVAIHPRFRETVTSGSGVPDQRVEVIRNWTHVEIQAPLDRNAIRAHHGWSEDETVILHAGNIGAKQALEHVVAAAEVAQARSERLRFVIVGDGNQAGRIRGLARGMRNLEMIDPLPEDEFTELLGCADVLLVSERPGLLEMSVPSKLTTYFAAGLPIIAATDADSITAQEMARSGAGIRVDAGNPQALVDAAIALEADPALRDRLGSSGRAYRDKSLDRAGSLEAFAALIARVAFDRRRRTRPISSGERAMSRRTLVDDPAR